MDLNADSSTVLFKLIDCVRTHPLLYDRSHPYFKSNKLRSKIWEKISRACNKPVKFCRFKWKALRSYWICSHIKNNSNNWLYYDFMKFLVPQVNPVDSKKDIFKTIDFNKLIEKHKNKKGKRYGDVKFTFDLIKKVMNYPEIYNQFGEEYKNAYFRSRLWKKLGSTLHMSGDLCRKRWNYLQTTFIKNYLIHKTTESDCWIYYDAMSFTIPYLKLNNESINIKQEIDENPINKCKQLMVRLVSLTEKDLRRYGIFLNPHKTNGMKNLDVKTRTMICSTKKISSGKDSRTNNLNKKFRIESLQQNHINTNDVSNNSFDADSNNLDDRILNDEVDSKCKLKIIKAVSKYPNIWNRNNENYFDNNLRNKIWNNIGRDLKLNSKECLKLWNNIIENFLRVIKYNKLLQWDLFEPCKFLLPHYKNELLASTDVKLKVLANSEAEKSLPTRSKFDKNPRINDSNNDCDDLESSEERIPLEILKECPQYENELKIISAQSIANITAREQNGSANELTTPDYKKRLRYKTITDQYENKYNENYVSDDLEVALNKSLDELSIPDYKKRLRYKTITDQYENKYNENYDSDDLEESFNHVHNNGNSLKSTKNLTKQTSRNKKQNSKHLKINPISKTSTNVNNKNNLILEKELNLHKNLQINPLNIKLECKSKELDQDIERCGEISYNKNNNTFSIQCMFCNNHIIYDSFVEHALTLHFKNPRVNNQNSIENNISHNSNNLGQLNCYPEMTIVPCTNINNDYLTDNDDFEVAMENSKINKTTIPRKRKKDPLKDYRKKRKSNNDFENSFFVNCIHPEIQIKEEIIDSDYSNFYDNFDANVNEINPDATQVPIKCEQCPRECKSWDKLKRHMQSHSNELLYKCDLCETRVKYKHNLKRHIRSKHGNKIRRRTK